MYTEDYRKEDFPYRKFYLKLILIVIVVALLVCLVASKIRKNNNSNIEPDGEINEVFSENLEKMKVKALEYFTENNVPKEIGDSVKLTLEQMISNKLTTPIKDKDQKLCNNKGSYIKLTKKENEYQLKVNLKCSDEEDYLILHLNNQNCNGTYLCEIKDDDSTEIEQVTDNDNQVDENIVNSSSNNNKNNVNSNKTTTTNKTQKPVTDSGTIIITSNSSNYLYEYKKTTNPSFSSWSKWNSWQTVNCNTKEITCNENDIKCLKELQRLDRKEKIDSYVKKYNTTKKAINNTANFTEYICSHYNIIKIDGYTYRLNNSADYKLVSSINKNTKKNVGGWEYNGAASYITPPSDTYNTHYILVGADYSNCKDTCNNLPKYIYDKYTYKGEIKQVNSYTCENNRSYNVPVYSTVTEAVSFSRTEYLYGTVCYKSERFRTLLSKGTTSVKWSNYDDKKLLNSGYNYTGKRKAK